MNGYVRCGTEPGYQRHRHRGEVTCRSCCAAHAALRASERGGDPVGLAEEIEHPQQYTAALAGREVAEALTAPDRARLVRELHGRGWTDVQVATLTRMSTFTVAEIRVRLGLAANATTEAAA